MKKINQLYLLSALMLLMAVGCRKMDRPALGNYPKDANPPGGPLKFYVAFDGSDVDSIRANFASDNPLTYIPGISGKAIQGAVGKFVKYIKPNDWAEQASSFSISYWYKRDGQTQNNKGTNGPEYIMSFKSNNGHWSGSSFLLFMEGNNTGCAMKVMTVDKNVNDNWFTWEGGNTIPGILDNKWHHIVITYNDQNSTMTLYVDGVANPITRVWNNHGGINFDATKITEMRIGAGPGTNYDTDDWLSSSFKGAIDQVRMYNTVLTQSAITALFNGKM